MTTISNVSHSIQYQSRNNTVKEGKDEIPIIIPAKPVERPSYHYTSTPFTLADGKMYSQSGLEEYSISDVVGKGLNNAQKDLKFYDLNGDGKILSSELASKMGESMAKLLDVNEDGLINNGEMMSFRVMQDSLDGSLDGTITDKGATQFQINRIIDFDGLKDTMKGVYDTLKVLFKPGSETATQNGVTHGLGDNSLWSTHFKEQPPINSQFAIQ